MSSFLEMVNPEPIKYEDFYYQIYVPDARSVNSKVYFNSECRAFIYKEKNQNKAAATDDMTSLEVEFRDTAIINKCCFKTVDEFRKGIDQYIKFYHNETQSLITQLQIVLDYIYLKNVNYHRLGKDGRKDLIAEVSKLTFEGGYRFTLPLSNQLNWIIEKAKPLLLLPPKYPKIKISCDDEKEDCNENYHPNKKLKSNKNSSKSSALSSFNHDTKDHDDNDDDNDAYDQEGNHNDDAYDQEGNHNNDDNDDDNDSDQEGNHSNDDDSDQDYNNKNTKKQETLNKSQDKLVQSFLVRIKFGNI